MQVEITTLGAGTFDGELKGVDSRKGEKSEFPVTLEALGDILNTYSLGAYITLTTQSGPILIQSANIVSIKRKR